MSSAGQADAVGGVFRVVVATYLAVHALRQHDVPALDLPGGVHAVRLDFETVEPTDDMTVSFSDGRRAFVSCKRKVGNDAALRSTVSDWIDQMDSLEGDDLLVIAAEDLSGVMKDLDQALRRFRAGQSSTRRAERDAIEAIKQQVPSAQEAAILSRVRVLHVPSSTSAPSLTRSLLNALAGFVVEDGNGASAVNALSAAFSHQAGRADGSDLDGWVHILRDAGHGVLADPTGPAGMRAAARAQALDAYRQALTTSKGRVDLTLLADDLPSVSVDLLAGIQVTSPNDNIGGRSLMPYVRRWRRALLVGLPGAGKSVALREIAACCVVDPMAPLPVPVHLGKLMSAVDASQITPSTLAYAAAEAVSPAHRTGLTQHIVAQLEAGNAMVLCDGLDECGARANWMVQQLSDILDTLPEQVGFIMATRATSATAAARLALPRLDLQTPTGLDDTIRAILAASASVRASDSSRTAWLDSRRTWLREAKKQHHDLFSVPLLAILAALMCANTTEADLPRSRARVLHAAVEQSVQRWERNREKIPGAWSPELTPRMLLDGYVVLGWLLEPGTRPSKADAIAALQDFLTDTSEWALAPAAAAEIAPDILRFWDEHVAVFVLDSSGRLTSRSKVFAEIASAMWTAKASPEALSEWLRERVAFTDSDGVIALAAGLNDRIVDVLLRLGEESGAATHLACDLVLTEQHLCTDDRAASLLGQLGAHTSQEVASTTASPVRRPRTPPQWHSDLEQPRAGAAPGWVFIELACRLPLAPEARSDRDRVVESGALPPRSHTIAAALRGLADAAYDDRDLTPTELQDVIAVMELPMPSQTSTVHRSRRRLEIISGGRVLPGVARVAVGATRHVAQLPATTAEWAFEVGMHSSTGTGELIHNALRAANIDVSDWWRQRSVVTGLAELAQSHEQGEAQLLEDLASTADHGGSTVDPWSLRAISDLLVATGYLEVGIPEFRAAFGDDSSELRRRWLAATATAFGIDPERVGRQAQFVLDRGATTRRDPASDLSVLGIPPWIEPELSSSGLASLTDDQQEALLDGLRAASDWIAFSAASVLVNIPSPTWDMTKLFETDMSSFRRRRAALAFMVAILSSGDDRGRLLRRAASSPDADYLAAAEWSVSLEQDIDPEGTVRDQFTRHPDLALRPKSAPATNPPCTYWTCDLCRSANDIDAEDCEGCDQGVRPDRG